MGKIIFSFSTIITLIILGGFISPQITLAAPTISGMKDLAIGEQIQISVTGLDANKKYHWHEYKTDPPFGDSYNGCFDSDASGNITNKTIGPYNLAGKYVLEIAGSFPGECRKNSLNIKAESFKVIASSATSTDPTIPTAENQPPAPSNPKASMTPFSLGNFLTNFDLVPNFKGNITLGYFISKLYPVVFLIITFVALYWLAWGVFEYIFAGGDKNQLASARKRITWAIVGMIFVLIAFLIVQYAGQILLPVGSNQSFNTLPIFSK